MRKKRDNRIGWQLTRLRDVSAPAPTANPAKKGPGTFLYVDIDALDNKRQCISSPKLLDNQDAPSRARILIKQDDILFSLVRPYLKNIAMVPIELDDQVASTAYCVLRPTPNVESRFLFYQLIQDSFIHSLPTYGNSPPAARDKEFLNMDVWVAPPEEQKRTVQRIEELFSDLDAGVAALERVKANLKRYRAAVLKAAVEGKLTEQWRAENPNAEPASKLLERILSKRRQKWEQDQIAKFAAQGKTPPKDWKEKHKTHAMPTTVKLPPLPGGWSWATTDQVGFIQLGRQRAPKYHSGQNMRPYLRVANVFEDRIDLFDVKEMDFAPEEYETYKLKSGDILLNEGQSMELIGRPALYRDEMPGACFTNTLIRFAACDGVIPEYALTVFLAYLKNKRFQKVATITVNIAHLGAARFAAIEFPLPPLAEQHQILTEVSRYKDMIKGIEVLVNRGLQRAARLRQSVLKRAFAGTLVSQSENEPSYC